MISSPLLNFLVIKVDSSILKYTEKSRSLSRYLADKSCSFNILVISKIVENDETSKSPPDVKRYARSQGSVQFANRNAIRRVT